MIRDEHKPLILSVAVGLSLWLVDALVNFLLFSDLSLLDSLVHGLSGRELYFHSVFLASFVFFGVAVSRLVARLRNAEEQARRALIKAEEEKSKTEAIIAAIGDGISIQDTDYKVLYQNDVHRGTIGDHVGEQCFRAYQKRDRVCPGCPIEKAFADGKIHTAEESGPLPDGRRMYVEITASPLRDHTGKIVAGIEVVRYIDARKKAEAERERLIAELQKALAEIKVLRGLIPICAWCKKIRNDQGYWEGVEAYLERHSDAQFTHGICAECLEKAFEEERKRGEKPS